MGGSGFADKLNTVGYPGARLVGQKASSSITRLKPLAGRR